MQSLKKYAHIGILILLMLFAFWLRMQTAPALVGDGWFHLVSEPDISYNLRQIEQILHTGNYAWFDAMTFYPTGDVIHWGSLFPYLAAALCVVMGATTRPEIYAAASYLPPLMGVGTIPLMYFIGKKLRDTRTGVLCACMTTAVSGLFFYRSVYGGVDHHIAEVFFGTLFCAFYIAGLAASRDIEIVISPNILRKWRDYTWSIAFSVLSGVAYVLGLMNMPTMVMFAFIAILFTIVDSNIAVLQQRRTDYLVLINTITFSIATIGAALYGFHHYPLNSLALYTTGQAFACIGIIVVTVALHALARYVGKERLNYIIWQFLVAVGIMGILYVAIPPLFELVVRSFIDFFGQSAEIGTVLEARSWDAESAFRSYNIGIITAILGMIVLVGRAIQKYHSGYTFVIIWSTFMFVSTIQHVRYEYYASINIALLTAIVVGYALDYGWKDLHKLVNDKIESYEGTKPEAVEPVKDKKKKKEKKKVKGGALPRVVREKFPDVTKAALCALLVAMGVIFAVMSLLLNVAVVNAYQYGKIHADWEDALEWIGENTPDTGVDYYAVYDATFEYPDTAYGIMSWWDYGHWLTFFSKRIPNANPFQHGVAGNDSASAYFMQTEEASANKILDNLGTRYVVTDIEMDTGKFWAMATWYNPELSYSPYMLPVIVNNMDGSQQVHQLFTQNYYMTMVSRLHNFDGSMVTPEFSLLVQYQLQEKGYPIVMDARDYTDFTEAYADVQKYANQSTGMGAGLFGVGLVTPPLPIPALQHYRLVYESPTTTYNQLGSDIRYVKVFEYVEGARVDGDGIIYTIVTTNSGRTFEYSQFADNGYFILPYPGIYTMEDGRTVVIDEDDVLEGRTVTII